MLVKKQTPIYISFTVGFTRFFSPAAQSPRIQISSAKYSLFLFLNPLVIDILAVSITYLVYSVQ